VTAVAPACRFCHAPLTETFVDLGEMPLANSYVSDAEAMNERLLPLHVCVCGSCLLVQVTDTVSPGELFSDYAYFSSFARSWVEHARRYAQTTIARYGLGADSLVVEVASNDGYLLQHFQERNIPVLGVEPAVNVAAAATAKGIPTEIAFFGAETARRLAGAGQRADLMVANNVLAHVPDILDFAEGFAVLLKPEGIATFEFPHVLNLIRGMQFDTIYHEHFSYLSLLVVERAFAAAGLKAIDVQEIPTHGGSLRLFAARQESSHRPADSLDRLRAKEIAAGLGGLEGYRGFAKRVADIKQEFLSFLAGVKAAGKTMAAYGAAAKGNSFLNYCCVGRDDIACVFDRSPAKQGKLLPGSHIPIVGPERLSEVRPDYLLILPWNLAAEIQEDQAILRSWDGKFVTAIPGLRVLP
jgi:SAM-dependent methyltransferase